MATPDINPFLRATKSGSRCTVGIALDTLKDADAQFLREVLAHPQMVGARVEDYSEATWGIRIPASAANRHVAKKCACGR